MKKWMTGLLALSVSMSAVMGLSAYEVAKKSEKVREGFVDSQSSQLMTLINAAGKESIRELSNNTLEGPLDSKSEGDMSLMTFISPADVKGTKLLTHEKLDRDDDQWLYLPALKRVKRIASKNKSGSFMGSEFSYEDISSQSLEKFTYQGEAVKEPCKSGDCYKYERVPTDEYSGYTKQIVWVDTTEFTVQKIEYYDRKKELLKTAEFTNTKIQDHWRFEQIHMKNHQTRKETILEWKEESLKNGLQERDFTKRDLKR